MLTESPNRLVVKPDTLTVDANSSGFLDQVNDAGKIDVRELKNISLYLDHVQVSALIGRTQASLDLSTKTTHCNTVIEEDALGTGGNATTIAFTPGDTLNAGHLDESAYPNIVFHYKTGVTTVTNFEAAIAASVHLAVKTAGTGANILADPADTFTATHLAGGTSTAGTFTLTVEKSIDGTNYALVGTKSQADFSGVANQSVEIVMDDGNGMPMSVESLKVTLTALESTDKFIFHAVGELR